MKKLTIILFLGLFILNTHADTTSTTIIADSAYNAQIKIQNQAGNIGQIQSIQYSKQGNVWMATAQIKIRENKK